MSLRLMQVLVSQDGKKSNEYDAIGAFSANGLAPVILWDKGCGYINRDFEEICELKYDDVFSFNRGLGCVEIDDKYGFIDKDGQEICKIKYDDVWAFSDEDIALVKKNGKFGFIDKSGHEVCKVKYTIKGYIGGSIRTCNKIEPFHEFKGFNFMGLAIIVENGRYGLINTKGQIVVEPKYDYIDLPYHAFNEDGNYIPYKLNGKMGYIDSTGKQLLLADYYDEVMLFVNGLACVCLNGKYGFIDTNFREICEIKYFLAYSFSGYGYAYVLKKVKFGLISYTLSGYIDRSGNFSIRRPKSY